MPLTFGNLTSRAIRYPTPEAVSGTGIVVHDPSMVKRPDGLYILYGTAPGISIATSTDREVWTQTANAFVGTDATPWANGLAGQNGNVWAPDVTYVNGHYVMYFCASKFGTDDSQIYLATSQTGLSGSWTYKGVVIESPDTTGANAIDPGLLIDGDRWFLSWGSFFNGIKQVELDPNTGFKLSGYPPVNSLAFRPGSSHAEEGAYIHRRGDYYYLYSSWDKCCLGSQSTYHINVGRSTSPTGPFLDKDGVDMQQGGGSQILGSHDAVIGPGGQMVLTDDGVDRLVYHWYHEDNSHSLGLNTLLYVDGWPFVEY
ncbi:hypothetical protein HKX48_002887 [Thoreauomyces humboldtii]|nr:hypothetical protein HKX48_002887 [Thoreauomyces humboldtii]